MSDNVEDLLDATAQGARWRALQPSGFFTQSCSLRGINQQLALTDGRGDKSSAAKRLIPS